MEGGEEERGGMLWLLSRKTHVGPNYDKNIFHSHLCHAYVMQMARPHPHLVCRVHIRTKTMLLMLHSTGQMVHRLCIEHFRQSGPFRILTSIT